MIRSSRIAFALLLSTGPVAAAAADDPSTDAAMIYAETCSVCHGDDGRGAVWGQASLATPPRNFRTAESRRDLTRERMIASATYGRPGTPMPGFGTQLGAEEISAVVDYIRAEFMAPAAAATEIPRQQLLPGNTEYGPIGPQRAREQATGEFTGDAGSGALLYAENCVACHGASGGGDGPRAYFIFPRPRNFHDPSTRQYLTRRNLYNGIKFGVVGKEMPAWEKVWSDEQIADVAEYVYRQFITRDAGATQ
jgi:mono/diheme cytochrome c family protein